MARTGHVNVYVTGPVDAAAVFSRLWHAVPASPPSAKSGCACSRPTAA